VIAPGDPYRQTHDRDVLGPALLALSPDHRIVVALRYYLDLTVEQIAQRLDVPAGTVHSRLHYALQKLHVAIDANERQGVSR
jgi:RNA polymerase sigma-70 factor (ECF subfamily)